MRLQNIRFPEPDICSEEELYFHRRNGWIDFNGYFNLFYIEKRKKYTNQETLTLHLEIEDCQAVRLMRDETVIREIGLSGKTETLELEFPYQDTDTGVFWFSVKPVREYSVNDMPQLTGWYEGKCQKEKPVRLAAVVCTFKREPYVLRNLKSILRFLERPENASLKLCYWLVDNGRTLSEHEEISRLAARYPETIRIIPNRNVGGAGGFTRGMIEAIEEKERLGLTHVQMMDDDAIMDPELFVRAYGFLGMRKDEWEDIRLGGTLMREDYPYMCQAMGEYYEKFKVYNGLALTDMRLFENCKSDIITKAQNEYRLYSGWWCCCYSLEIVRKDNLPLQIFIHRDDIEYEVRNKKTGIVFLNGFNVWHKGFEVNFLGVNAYYDVRNSLIFCALHENDTSKIDIYKWLIKIIIASTMRFRYEEAYFAYRGVEDFIKGPMWLKKQNQEKMHIELRKLIPKSTPIEGDIKIEKSRLYRYYDAKKNKCNLIKQITFNGWFLPAKKSEGILYPVDSPFLLYRREKAELIDIGSKNKRIGKKEWKYFFRMIYFCIAVICKLQIQYSANKRKYIEYMKNKKEKFNGSFF